MYLGEAYIAFCIDTDPTDKFPTQSSLIEGEAVLSLTVIWLRDLLKESWRKPRGTEIE